MPNASAAPLLTLERAIRLLQLLADAPGPLTMAEMGQRMGTSASTIHRVLATLAEFGLVEKDSRTRRYRLGLGVLQLADARARTLDLRDVARPYIEALRDSTRETVTLSIPRGHEAVDIERAESPQELRQSVEIGRAIPLAGLGARSKALLAYLPEAERAAVLDRVAWEGRSVDRAALEEELEHVRARGTARSFAERVIGGSALAAPILDRQGRPAAALVVSGPLARWTAEAMDRWEPDLRAAARAIERAMGVREDGGPNARG